MLIKGRNVNHVFAEGCLYLRDYGKLQKSRAGDVLVCDHPVMSVYDKPTERVLFSWARDANPFFHLMESLWMLNGGQDARWLDQFVKDFSSRFAETNGLLWGAYGHRWRNHFDMDQLKVIVDRLTKNPDDRRVVLTMWDPTYDLCELRDYQDLDIPEPKDLPCNTHVYPRIVNGALDITVCCRSNDIIWGAYGANAVHFSILQEYLAAGIGVGVGKLYQLSNNFHAYVDVFEKIMKDGTGMDDPYRLNRVHTVPLVDDFGRFDKDLFAFMSGVSEHIYANRFFPEVAKPMLNVAKVWRSDGASAAVVALHAIKAEDWKWAAKQFLSRRAK